MSSCENIVSLIGHVGSEPENLDDDVISVKFFLYTNESFYSNKKRKFIQITEKHLIKAWKQNAEFTRNNISKGDYIRVRGKLHYHPFIVNNIRYVNPEIIASNILKLDKKIEKHITNLTNINNKLTTLKDNISEKYHNDINEILKLTLK